MIVSNCFSNVGSITSLRQDIYQYQTCITSCFFRGISLRIRICIKGTTKARVLPLPVTASAAISLLSIKWGMHAAWNNKKKDNTMKLTAMFSLIIKYNLYWCPRFVIHVATEGCVKFNNSSTLNYRTKKSTLKNAFQGLGQKNPFSLHIWIQELIPVTAFFNSLVIAEHTVRKNHQSFHFNP